MQRTHKASFIALLREIQNASCCRARLGSPGLFDCRINEAACVVVNNLDDRPQYQMTKHLLWLG